MAIHVQDEETDWLVREFARRHGIGITAAIKRAIQEASGREREEADVLARRLEPIWSEIRMKKKADVNDEKAFMDEMWDEDG